MTRTRFLLIAAILGWFAHDGRSQVHMSAGTVPLTDARGVQWTPNICTGWNAFANPGTYSSPIYNATAYTAAASVPIVCTFNAPSGTLHRILVHLIEPVRTFNAVQKRVFDIFVNGDAALENVDIFARASAVLAPVDVAFMAYPIEGQITVSFLQQSPPRSSAIFAGIEILPLVNDAGLTVTRKSDTRLVVGPGCSVSAPCRYRFGSVIYAQRGPATIDLNSGDGQAWLYLAANGNLIVGSTGLDVVCSGCLYVDGIGGFPADSLPLETWNATSGVWDAKGESGRAVLSASPQTIAGSSINILQTGSSTTISVAPVEPQ